MAGLTGVLIFAAAIVLAIVLGEKLKVNQGILALAFAFLIASFENVAPTNVIAKCFPSGTMYLVLMVAFFYGYMNETGLIKALSSRIVWAFRKRQTVIPFATYAAAFVLSAMGGGGEGTVLVLSPLFFRLAATMGYDPILAVIACACGACSASFLFWVGSGSFMIGIVEQFLGAKVGFAAIEASAAVSIVAGILLFTIFYFATKGYKIKKVEFKEAPEPMTFKQKLSLVIMAGVLICLMGLPLLNMLLKSMALGRVLSFLNIRVVMTIGVIVCALCGCGDERKILREAVPWGLILMLCGVMTLISLMSEVGTVEYIKSLISNSMSGFAAVAILFVVACVLGAATSGLTVIMLCCQLVPVLAEAAGLSVPFLMCVAACGTNAMFISPYSIGGALALGGCPDQLKSSVVKKQYLAMAAHAVITFGLTVSGFAESIVRQLSG